MRSLQWVLAQLLGTSADISGGAHIDAMDVVYNVLSTNPHSIEESRMPMDSHMRLMMSAGPMARDTHVPRPPDGPLPLVRHAQAGDARRPLDDMFDLPVCRGDCNHPPHIGPWYMVALRQPVKFKRELNNVERITAVLHGVITPVTGGVALYHVRSAFNIADQFTKPTNLAAIRDSCMVRVPRFT
jgi:hypothetical protein